MTEDVLGERGQVCVDEEVLDILMNPLGSLLCVADFLACCFDLVLISKSFFNPCFQHVPVGEVHELVIYFTGLCLVESVVDLLCPETSRASLDALEGIDNLDVFRGEMIERQSEVIIHETDELFDFVS